MSHDYDLDELLREFSSYSSEPELPSHQSQPLPQPEPVSPAPQYEAPPQEEEEEDYYEDAPHPGDYEEHRDEYAYHHDSYEESYPDEEDEDDDYYEDEEEPKKKKNILFEIFMSFTGLICFGLSCIVLLWVGLNVHPSVGASTAVATEGTKLNLADRLDVYMNNAAADALGDLAYIRKIYTIDEGAAAAPAPDPNAYGTTDDPAVIQAVIDEAWELLEGQEMIWDPNVNFVYGEPFRYYYDETILVLQWKEWIEGRSTTCMEVKLAHGSQFRRKLVEDSYSSSVRLYATELAASVNAVAASNADFYAFRDEGITVYQRKLYRNNPKNVDSCFITADGDMLFTRAGELSGPGETEKFIQDNNVVFSLCFGPVLVENGEAQYCPSYPIGEIDLEYSRACIAQKGKLHYLVMTINHSMEASPRCNVNQLAQFIASKGVDKAYNLDGGQTSEIVFQGAPVNHVDYGYERTVSDIIYFATALPPEEVTQ